MNVPSSASLARRARPYLLIVLAVALLFVWLGRLPARRVGDGSEYYAMLYAWSTAWRPWTTAVSQAAYDALLATGNVTGLVTRDWFDTYFGALRIADTTDFNHFWFYSLLAVLCQKLLLLFGIALSDHASFLVLHAVLVTATIAGGWRCYHWRGVAVMLMLIAGSPVLWYLDKVHTELFTVCLLALAVMQMQRARYAAAALLLALVSTQNPSFALLAGLPWACRVLLQWRQRYSGAELAMLAGAAVTVLLHPAYYLLRYGVPTPQLLAGGADLGGNLSTFYIWLLDPDLGLLPNWPLGTAALLLGGVLWLRQLTAPRITRGLTPDGVRPQAFGGTPPHPLSSAPAVRRTFAAFVVAYLLLNFYAQSSTTNLNSGGTPGLARYALWYLPLALPLLLWLCARMSWRRWQGLALGVLLLLLTVAAVVRYDPRRPEHYGEASTLSYQLQWRLPWLYDPPPEVFMERFSGVGEARTFDLVVGPDCRKTLLIDWTPQRGAIAPRKCMYDLNRLTAYRQALGASASRYVDLRPAQMAQLRIVPVPGHYRVGLGGNGSFVLGGSWSAPEAWGVWSQGRRAELFFPCDAQPLRLSLALQPFDNQTLAIRAGKTVLWQGPLPAGGPPLNITVPPEHCRHGAVSLRLDLARPVPAPSLAQSAVSAPASAAGPDTSDAPDAVAGARSSTTPATVAGASSSAAPATVAGARSSTAPVAGPGSSAAPEVPAQSGAAAASSTRPLGVALHGFRILAPGDTIGP